MRRLVDAITASIDPVSLMRRVAEQTCLFTTQANGAAVSLCAPDDCFVIVSAHGATVPQLGQVVPFGRTFSATALYSRRTEVLQDVLADRLQPVDVRGLAVELGVRSCVAIPLVHNNTAIGVLTVTAAQSYAFSDADVAALDSLSELVAALIGSHSEMSRLLGELFNQPGPPAHARSATAFLAELMIPGRAEDERLNIALDGLFKPGAVEAVFQPIVSLQTRTTMAVEALCRFSGDPQFDTAQWFSCARRMRRGIDLEMHSVQVILDASRDLPADLPVTINLSPLAALESSVQDIIVAADRKIIVEITEHEPFPEDFAEALEPLRRRGIRIAVDDAGAGYANFAEIMRLRPDIIKIDGALTGGIDRDPVRRALTYAVVRLAEEIGATTVAEAVEGDAQCVVLQGIGVAFGQGHFLGSPAPAHVHRRAAADTPRAP